MAFKILVIDEEMAEIEKVQFEFDPWIEDKSFEVDSLLPIQNLNEMIDLILQEKPNAIIVDYQLNRVKTDIGNIQINYNGAILISEFLKRRVGFPCFIASSYENDAVDDKNTLDVNIIYSKSDLNNPNSQQIRFRERVKKQISKYIEILSMKELRLNELVDKKRDNGSLSLPEEEELIEIDSFLENSLDKNSAIPKALKEHSNMQKLKELISITEEFMSAMNNGK